MNGIVDAFCLYLAMERVFLMSRACNGTMETSFDLLFGLGETIWKK